MTGFCVVHGCGAAGVVPLRRVLDGQVVHACRRCAEELLAVHGYEAIR